MKRILSLLLTIAMLVSMMATTVFATDGSEDTPVAVAQIGDTTYATLADAVAAAEAGTTVTLVGDAAGTGVVIDKSITIDLGGYTYTFNAAVGSSGTETLGFQILAGNTVTIQNGTLTSTAVVDGNKEVKVLIQNYANLTLTSVNLVDNTDHIQYALSNNSGSVVLNGSTSISTDAVAFDVYDYSAGGYEWPTVTVNTTGTISGNIEVSNTCADNLTIKAGTFTTDVTAYCADGFQVTDDGNGNFVVAEKPVGTEENPVYVSFTMNETHSEGTATVTVPAGATYYFATTNNISGMNMTANGVEVEVEYGDMWMGTPSTWTITNTGEEAVEYALKVAYPLGHMMNPEVIESMSWYNDEVVQAEGDSDGYFYIYTAPADGTITLYFSAIYDEETWEAIDFGDQRNILVTNNTTYAQYSLLADGVDNSGLELVVPVAANDEIIINTCWTMDAEGNNYPAATYSWNGNFQYPAGSEENPISPDWAWDADYANATASITVAAGETVYVYGTAGMNLTIDGVETEMDESGVFVITNFDDAEATYALALATPVGAYSNPEVIEGLPFEDSNSLAADGSYNYIWTAEEDATVALSVTDGANITVDKLTYVEGSEWPISEQFVLAEPEIDENWNYTGWTVAENLVLDVKAGQQLKIQVNALTDWTTWSTPAIEYTLTVGYAPGTERNPIDLTSDLLYEEDFSATVTVAAGETVYYCAYRVGGMIMTINDGDGVTCTTDGMMMPYSWSITNDSDADADYVITVGYPAGNQMNPAELAIGENTASIEAGSQGYFYAWTAEEDGALTITMPEGDWTYAINNITAGTYGDTQWSDSDPVVNPATVEVTAGDEIQIVVNTYDPVDMWSNPAGDLVINAEFTANPGEMSNPIYPDWNWNEEGTEATATVTIPAGKTHYFGAYVSGMVLSIDEEVYGMLNGSRWMPAIFTITNDGKEAAEYALKIAYPVGSMSNPAVAVQGDNVASIEAGNNQGYFFTYTAEYTGNLAVTISGADGWTYAINNMTSFVYGDTQWSDSNPVVNPAYVAVSKGDEIQIMVNSYDPANVWSNPAAELNVNLAYLVTAEGECASGDATVDVLLSLAELELPNANAMVVYIHSDELELMADGSEWQLTDSKMKEVLVEENKASWGYENEDPEKNAIPVNGEDGFLKLTFKAPETVGEYGFTCDVIVKYEDEVVANVLVDGNVNVVKKLFKLAGANMTLGNDLAMNFMVNKTDIDNVENYYVKITKTYADGRDNVVVESKLGSYNSKYYSVKFNGISAKEMNDEIYVQVFNNDGTAVSEVYTDSIVGYAMRAMDKQAGYSKTLMVDMLNYGAAAQVEFNYDASNLANSRMTAEQKACATQSTAVKDYRVKGTNYYGTNLTLKSNLMLNFFFKNINPDMYAVVTFTKHTGEAKNIRIEGSEFVKYNATVYRVPVNELVIADARQLVTCKVYNADGTLVANAIDSVESYVARVANVSELYETIMKFADSAYAYLHNR